jgi:hypothetical protein
MPFESSWEEATATLVHRARGQVTSHEVITLAREWRERLGDQLFHALWDVRGAHLDLSLAELSSPRIAEHVAWLNRHRRTGRHCYLVDSQLTETMLRFFEDLGMQVEWAIFHEEREARAWLARGGELQRT